MTISKEHRNHEIIRNLRIILNRRRLSQREFACLLNKKESEISRWFSEKCCISRSTQSKIESVLQEPISSDSTFIADNGLVKIGIIGTGNIARRFASEVQHVHQSEIVAAYGINNDELYQFCEEFDVKYRCVQIQELINESDAVYIASPIHTHYEYAKMCLLNNKHVLCEMPFTTSKEEAKELYQISYERKRVLMPALKTAYCPSFIQMNEIAKSGIIGEVVDVTSTITTLLPECTPASFYNERLLENAAYPLLACFKILGSRYGKMKFFNKQSDGKVNYSHITIEYPDSIASLRVGVGVKSEGSLVISGTKGYIYVPAPWWKMDYFEVRFENQNDNKKYFFPYESDGLRYEIQTFITSINNSSLVNTHVTKEENFKILEIQTKIVNNGKQKTCF